MAGAGGSSGSRGTSNARRRSTRSSRDHAAGAGARRPAVRPRTERRAHIATRAALCEQGIAEAGDDDARTIELYAQLGLYRWFAGETQAGLAAAREGLRRAERLGDPRLIVIAQLARGLPRDVVAGHHAGPARAGAAAEATLDPPLPFYQSPPRRWPAARVLRRPGSWASDPRGQPDVEGEGVEHTRGFVYIHPDRGMAARALGPRSHYARAVREYTAQAHDPQYRATAATSVASSRATEASSTGARLRGERARNARSVGDEPMTIANEAPLATSTSWRGTSRAAAGGCARSRTAC